MKIPTIFEPEKKFYNLGILSKYFKSSLNRVMGKRVIIVYANSKGSVEPVLLRSHAGTYVVRSRKRLAVGKLQPKN